MSIKLSEYQALALRTAKPTALSDDYIVPALVGEVGELFGKRAKAVRDGWTPEQLSEALVSEYGDVAWETAVLLHLHGVTAVPKETASTIRHKWATKVDPWTSLQNRAASIFSAYSEGNPEDLPRLASLFWAVLEYRCKSITGSDWGTVLQANVDKLSSRLERGTIGGSGDNR